MKNKEKYVDDIIAIASNGYNIAVRRVYEQVVGCEATDCRDCVFLEGNCAENRQKWLESEADPTIDELKAELETVKKERDELRARLEKAVELPYEQKRLLWGDKDKETLLCPDCLTDIMGGIGDETFVVQCPNCGCFVNSAIEPIEFTAATESRLNELKGDKQ